MVRTTFGALFKLLPLSTSDSRRLEIVPALSTKHPSEPIYIQIDNRAILYLGTFTGARNYAAREAGATESIEIRTETNGTWYREWDRNGLNVWKAR